MLAARWATQVQTFANMRTQVDAEPRGYLRPAIARVMAESEHGGGFPAMPRYASRPTSPMVWIVCCATAPVPPLRWNGCVKSTRTSGL